MSESSGEKVLRVRQGGTTTLRAQLVWAALFPLATFVLLSVLVATVAFRQMTLALALERDTARVQAIAGDLAASLSLTQTSANAGLSADIKAGFSGENPQLFLIDQSGNVISHPGPGGDQLGLTNQELANFIRGQEPASQLTQTIPAEEEIIASYAPLPGRQEGLVMEEPWSSVMAPAAYYQLILIGLLVLGTVFSLYILSLSAGRVTGSIARLAENADRAVPGSVFHPMVEQGPLELRQLINAFNKMVVQLAEQQSSQRQYAHKALLSQEEERQRLSHELHDGTCRTWLGWCRGWNFAGLRWTWIRCWLAGDWMNCKHCSNRPWRMCAGSAMRYGLPYWKIWGFQPGSRHCAMICNSRCQPSIASSW